MSFGDLMNLGTGLMSELTGLDATLVKVTRVVEESTSTATLTGTGVPIKVRRKTAQLADRSDGVAIESGRGVYLVSTSSLPDGGISTKDRLAIPALATGTSSTTLLEQSAEILRVDPVHGGVEVEVAS